MGVFVRHFYPRAIEYARVRADKITNQNPELKSPLEYCTILKKESEERGSEYFHRTTPGPLDASIYGAMARWWPGSEIPTMSFMADALSQSGLSVWYENVGLAIPHMWMQHGWYPFYV